MVKVVIGMDANKATGSKANVGISKSVGSPLLKAKAKACQINPKDRSRPRPCSPKARPRP